MLPLTHTMLVMGDRSGLTAYDLSSGDVIRRVLLGQYSLIPTQCDFLSLRQLKFLQAFHYCDSFAPLLILYITSYLFCYCPASVHMHLYNNQLSNTYKAARHKTYRHTIRLCHKTSSHPRPIQLQYYNTTHKHVRQTHIHTHSQFYLLLLPYYFFLTDLKKVGGFQFASIFMFVTQF